MNTQLKNTLFKQQFFFLFALVLLFSQKGIAQSGGAIFQAGPNMMRGKIFPTATLLPNGNVITFSGRETGFISCSYSDMYDAINNTFTEKQMNIPHDASATVKLASGNYLLLGGGMDYGVPAYPQTEMYYTALDTFVPIGSMNMSRMQHAGIQMANGEVLIVGAWYNPTGALYAEIFDTLSKTYTQVGALNDPRSQPMIFPTNDSGAIVTSGWDTYGGNIKTTVEYYSSLNKNFTLVSSELIPSDPGWVPIPVWTRPIEDCKMSNGKYLMMAYRTTPIAAYALVEFDPATKLFSIVNTSSPLRDSLTDGGFADFVLNSAGNMVYLVGFDSGYDPQRVSIVTVDLANGNTHHPNSTYTLPANEYFYSSYTYIPSVNKILVQGINGGNAGYFTGTEKTYLLTPTINVSTQNISKDDRKITCYPNPTPGRLSVVFNTQINKINIALYDVQGRLVESNEIRNQATWETNLNYLQNGIYYLKFSANDVNETHKVVIAK